MNIREMLRHKRNRDRELAIVAKKTEEAQLHPETIVKDRHVSQHETLVAPSISAQVREQLGIDNTVNQSNVRKACKAGLGIIATQGSSKLRQQVMSNLPSEIRIVLQGRSAQEAFDFYWSIDEFCEVWGKLGFTEQTLQAYIAHEVTK